MKRSTERILTTHTGSLPRPWDLVATLEALDAGTLPEPAAFEARVRHAVAEAVRKQVAAGVDIVNDGEQGKVGYSTYVRHRLSGFDGSSVVAQRADWADFPEALARHPRSSVSRPSCTGPIEWRDRAAVGKDVANLAAALTGVKPADAFMTAASPGVIAHFLRNEHYPSREAYLARLTDVMKEEYDAIARAGFVLQVDCPDLAMSRHMGANAELSTDQFRTKIVGQIEALNHAVANISPEQLRLHLCWGNYEGPHHRDVPLRDILPVVLRARPHAISLEGANPRHEHEWAVFRDVKLPDDKILIPGVLDSTTNFIEHPELVAQRIVRYAEVVGRERVIAGSDCGFGTFARATPQVEPEIVWAKLAAMAEGARLASAILWR